MSLTPTHRLDWDASLNLAGKPVLFCEFTLDCAVTRDKEGSDMTPTHILMNTGLNRKTGEIENEICLRVPYAHTARDEIIRELEKGSMATAFDMLFAYMLARHLQEDDVLKDELELA